MGNDLNLIKGTEQSAQGFKAHLLLLQETGLSSQLLVTPLLEEQDDSGV